MKLLSQIGNGILALAAGGEIMEMAEVRLEALGCPKINLQVRTNNNSVIDFYQSLGYKTEDRVQMGKPLGDYSAA